MAAREEDFQVPKVADQVNTGDVEITCEVEIQVPTVADPVNMGRHVEIIVSELQEELDRIPPKEELPRSGRTIYKVPHFLRRSNEDAYTPKLVSIGPYHHGKEALSEMEHVKLSYFLDFTKRSGGILHECVKIVEQHTDDVLLTNYDRAEFTERFTRIEIVKMMVVDCCFILEFLIKWFVDDRKGQAKNLMTKLPMLKNDLLLVENQIPFFLLEEMYQRSDVPKVTMTKHLKVVVLSFFMGKHDDTRSWSPRNPDKKFDHLLHVYHAFLTYPVTGTAVLITSLLTEFNEIVDDAMEIGSSIASTLLLLLGSLIMKILSCIVKCFSIAFQLLFMITVTIFFLAIAWPLTKIFGSTLKCFSLVFKWISSQCIKNSTVEHSVTEEPVNNSAEILGDMIMFIPLLSLGHLRGLLRKGRNLMVPQPETRSSGIPNACTLRDSGFSLKKKHAKEYEFMDVSLRGNKIKIPELCISEGTLVLFRNLIAFEQYCHDKDGKYNFTTYAMFMDYLIDSTEDVAMLKECRIIDNRLGDDKEVADFFNGLCKGIRLEDDDEHYLSTLFKDVAKYYKTSSHKLRFYRWRKRLIPDYFANPWAIPSMIAASILLTLGGVQTFYTVYAYYRPRT